MLEGALSPWPPAPGCLRKNCPICPGGTEQRPASGGFAPWVRAMLLLMRSKKWVGLGYFVLRCRFWGQTIPHGGAGSHNCVCCSWDGGATHGVLGLVPGVSHPIHLPPSPRLCVLRGVRDPKVALPPLQDTLKPRSCHPLGSCLLRKAWRHHLKVSAPSSACPARALGGR